MYPDTFFINTQDRWLTTTGAEKAGQLIPDYIVKPSVRNETTQFQHGTPNAILKTASYVPTKHEQSKRNQLEGFDVGCSKATTIAPLHDDKDNHHKSHTIILIIIIMFIKDIMMFHEIKFPK